MWRLRWLKSLRQRITSQVFGAQGIALAAVSETNTLALSDDQQLLVRVLGEVNDQLALIYRSSLSIASTTKIPEHQVLAAHQARELMEKLPRAVGCAWADPQGKVEKLRDLMTCYAEHAKPHRKLFTATEPTSVEWPVLRYLVESDNTFIWHDAHITSVRENIAVLIRHCHRTASPSPRTMTSIAREWRSLRCFFVDLCHHRSAASTLELHQHIESLTQLLLWLLRPRPVADFDEIDALIAEGDPDGD